MQQYYHEYELKDYPNYRLIRNCNEQGNDDTSQCWLIKQPEKSKSKDTHKWPYETPRFTSVTDAIEYMKAH